jgi:hypothetical protein
MPHTQAEMLASMPDPYYVLYALLIGGFIAYKAFFLDRVPHR